MSYLRSLKTEHKIIRQKVSFSTMLISISQKLCKRNWATPKLLFFPLPISSVADGRISFPHGTPESPPFGCKSNAGLTWCLCQNTQAPSISIFTPWFKLVLLAHAASSLPSHQLPGLPPVSSSCSYSHSPSGRRVSNLPSGGADSASFTVSLRIDSFTEHKQKAPKRKPKQINKALSHFLCHPLNSCWRLNILMWLKSFKSQFFRLTQSPGHVVRILRAQEAVRLRSAALRVWLCPSRCHLLV